MIKCVALNAVPRSSECRGKPRSLKRAWEGGSCREDDSREKTQISLPGLQKLEWWTWKKNNKGTDVGPPSEDLRTNWVWSEEWI